MDDLQYEETTLKYIQYVLVLNLIINGWPSIPRLNIVRSVESFTKVLNLIINGWPSIL